MKLSRQGRSTRRADEPLRAPTTDRLACRAPTHPLARGARGQASVRRGLGECVRGTFARVVGELHEHSFGAGKRAPTGRLDVAMIQSLVRNDAVADLVAGYGQVIVDECHHLPAISFERVLAEVKARWVVGLTATPQRRDGHHPITQMQLGPVRFSIDAKSQAGRRPFEHRLVVRLRARPRAARHASWYRGRRRYPAI